MAVVVVRVHLQLTSGGISGRASGAAIRGHTCPQRWLALEPLLDLSAMDPVLARSRSLVAFAVAVVAIGVEHLDLEVWRENSTRSHFVGDRGGRHSIRCMRRVIIIIIHRRSGGATHVGRITHNFRCAALCGCRGLLWVVDKSMVLLAEVLVAIGDHDRIQNLLLMLLFNHPDARLPSAGLLIRCYLPKISYQCNRTWKLSFIVEYHVLIRFITALAAITNQWNCRKLFRVQCKVFSFLKRPTERANTRPTCTKFKIRIIQWVVIWTTFKIRSLSTLSVFSVFSQFVSVSAPNFKMYLKRKEKTRLNL